MIETMIVMFSIVGSIIFFGTIIELCFRYKEHKRLQHIIRMHELDNSFTDKILSDV